MVFCNLDLGLAQILPMLDEETGAEPKIVKASLADPFLVLIRDDASIFVARCGEDNDLEEIEQDDDILLTTKWLTGCLYKDTASAFKSIQRNSLPNKPLPIYMFLLNTEGTLYVSVCNRKSRISTDASLDICVAGSWKPHLCGRRSFFRPSNNITSVYSSAIDCQGNVNGDIGCRSRRCDVQDSLPHRKLSPARSGIVANL
jgi:hypothetical protein